jgi:hypothetical protein
MVNVFDVLRDVAARPELFLGGGGDARAEQLRNLQWFLLGYQAALDGTSPHKRFVLDFGSYLRGRFGWSMTCGPIAAVLEAYADSRKAWTVFWQLVADFEQAGGSQTGQ